MKLLSALAAISIAALSSEATSAVLPPLDPIALDVFGQSSVGSAANILFVNQLDYSVDLYWINYSGNRQFYQTIAANSQYLQPTFLTHPWVIAQVGSGDTTAQGTGTLIAGFIAQTAGVSGDIAYITSSTGAVPEPATWLMMLTGFSLVGGALRRKTVTSTFGEAQ